ncbi:hypothetical protein V3C99_008899 [Haemonchus contortus]|uniref:HSF_DOMAIN domain-containing protein n=1 Tax=Haemonchus contortus TaxID=6289 RepID=A0A7I4YKV0_HAECO
MHNYCGFFRGFFSLKGLEYWIRDFDRYNLLPFFNKNASRKSFPSEVLESFRDFNEVFGDGTVSQSQERSGICSAPTSNIPTDRNFYMDYHPNRSLKNWTAKGTYDEMDDSLADIKGISPPRIGTLPPVEFDRSKWKVVLDVNGGYVSE